MSKSIVSEWWSLDHAVAVDWVLETTVVVANAQLTKGLRGVPMTVGTSHGVPTARVRPVLSSPLYMSPEHVAAPESVDERADIWALGVILFSMIAGTPPFLASSMAELATLLLSADEAPRLIAAAPDAPIGLSNVVATCLMKNREDRFVNLADFADALMHHAGPAGVASARAVVEAIGMPSRRATLAAHIAGPSGVRFR